MTSDKSSSGSQLLDMSVVQRLAEANYNATGMPIGIIDAFDGSILVACGWRDVAVHFHREHPRSLERCRESDDYIKRHLSTGAACEYTRRNSLRDIGVPIVVAGDTTRRCSSASSSTPTSRRTRSSSSGRRRSWGSTSPRTSPRSSASPSSIAAQSRTPSRTTARSSGSSARLAEGRAAAPWDQQAPRESEERFRMLADNMAQLAWIADERGRMLVQQAVVRLHRPAALEIPMGPSRIRHPDHRERVVAKIRRCFETGEPWGRSPIKGKDSSYRWFLSRSHPIRDAAGEGHPLVRDQHRRHGAAPGGGGAARGGSPQSRIHRRPLPRAAKPTRPHPQLHPPPRARGRRERAGAAGTGRHPAADRAPREARGRPPRHDPHREGQDRAVPRGSWTSRASCGRPARTCARSSPGAASSHARPPRRARPRGRGRDPPRTGAREPPAERGEVHAERRERRRVGARRRGLGGDPRARHGRGHRAGRARSRLPSRSSGR